MALQDFLVGFHVRAPYYLRAMHNGTGQKFLVFNDDYIKNVNRERWFTCEVIRVGVSVHTNLGSLLEIDIDV